MAYRNVFKKPNDNISSSDYIERKKAKSIFKGAIDLAKNDGILHKQTTTGQNKGSYIGDIYASSSGSKCLVGANSYESLLSVTKGSHLINPQLVNKSINNDLLSGNSHGLNFEGLNTVDASFGGMKNTVINPTEIYLDPCGQLFSTNIEKTSEVCLNKSNFLITRFL